MSYQVKCSNCKKEFNPTFKYWYYRMEICEECHEKLIQRGVVDDQW